MRDSYLVFGQPLIEDAEVDEVVHSLKSSWLGTGPKVAEFEKRVAKYKGVEYAVALNSCTAGLHLACLAMGLKPGDEVIVPAMTFCATVNAVVHAGATPVLADVDPLTFNIDPDSVATKISPRTKAILPVHFAGRACEMDRLTELARRHDLKIIEDCAHAIETEFESEKAGSIGDCGVLSFYSTKNVVTGEGGIVLTNDADVAARIKMLALHGMSQDAWKRFSDDGYKHYEVAEIGFKYNMMDLQAAIGMHQIERVDSYWEKRRAIWLNYMEELKDLPVTLPAPLSSNSRHALHLFTLLIDEEKAPVSRDKFITEMHKRNIGTGVHYRAIPVHPIYRQKFGWSVDEFPAAHKIGEETVSLPLSAKLTDKDVADVIEAVRDILSDRNG